MNKAKKQRIVYKDDAKAKAAELEEFLFGTGGDPSAIFDREKEEGEETVAELVKQASRGGGLLRDTELFFEDARGAASSGSSSDDDDDDGDEDDDEDAPGGLQLRLPSGSGSSGEGEEEEEEEEDEKEEEEQKEGDEGEGGTGRARGKRGKGEEDEAEEEEDGGGGGGGKKKKDKAAAGRKDGQRPAGRPGASGGGGGGGAARGPAWNDPDDAAIRVDVAGVNRLRKLRTSEKQNTMGGSEYEAALRKQHQALNPRTSWANKKAGAKRAAAGDDEDDEGQEEEEEDGEAAALLGRAGGLTERPAGRRLPPGQIETTRLKDANRHQPSDAVVQAVRFHPNGQMLLTAGLDKKLRLFQVDGLRNPLLQGLHLDDMPITDAAFASAASYSAGGHAAAAADRVVLAGRRPHFYMYDMGTARVERVLGPVGCPLKSLERFAVSPCGGGGGGSESVVAFTGDGGFIPLVSLRSRQWVANLKMSGNVRALAFSADGSELLSTGDDGVVHVWDLRTRRCRLAFADAGNIGDASSLALSADGRFVATGAKSGVVNVYRREEVEAAAARAATAGVAGAGLMAGGRVSVSPARELMNLTTNVDTLVFSPDSQMLAMASRMKRDSLRLVHLPSLTVFSNWPTGRSPLHYVHCADFSPHCGMLTIGNAKGRALLYRLHHYQQA